MSTPILETGSAVQRHLIPQQAANEMLPGAKTAATAGGVATARKGHLDNTGRQESDDSAYGEGGEVSLKGS